MKRDLITDAGLAVVGLAAAILTFTTLRDLGTAVGIVGELWFGFQLSWLVPITIDAAGVVAARIWLQDRAGEAAVQFARALAWACMLGSVAGNAGQHAMAAFSIPPPWWCVVAVTAVPPGTLVAVVHLYYLKARGAAPPQVEKVTTSTTTPMETSPPPVDAEVEKVETAEELIAAGAGRKTLMAKLDITEHQARQLLRQHRGEVAS